MSARVDVQPSFVLRTWPYRETSLLLEMFSADHGRLGAVARGARGPRSRWRGLLQPFCPLLVGWRETGDLVSLSFAEPAGPATALAGDRVPYGWYLNELLLRLLPRRDPHPELFTAYADTLPRIGGDGSQAALRRFEYRLLAAVGYALPVPQPVDPAAYYRIDPQHGWSEATKIDSEAVSGRTLLALQNSADALDDAAMLRQARRVLSAALDALLGDRPLETPRLLRALREGFARDAR